MSNEVKIFLGQTIIGHPSGETPGSGSPSFSNAITLSKIVSDRVLLGQLENLGIIDTAYLWLPVAFAQIVGDFDKTALLNTLARHLSVKSSPFKPQYQVHYDYGISVESNSTVNASQTVGSPDSDECKATFFVEMKLPVGSISSSASLVLPAEQFYDSHEEKVEKIRDFLLAAVVSMHYETFPLSLNEKDLAKPVKTPLLTELLDLLKKPIKGSLDLRLSEVIIRRYGLLSGRIDTLDEIAKDLETSKNITRERVRQLGEKALELISSRKRMGTELFSSFNAFKSQIQLWLSTKNHVAHVQEVADHFKDYIDFDKYETISSMAFLCSIAGLFVEASHHDSNSCLVSTSDSEYKSFATAYKVVTNSNIDEPGVNTETLLRRVRETRMVVDFTDLDSIGVLRTMANKVIGPPRVMPYDDFLTSIIRQCLLGKGLVEIFRQADQCYPDSNDESRRLVCNLATISFVPAAEYERIMFGTWITCGLTERAQDIVRAIIYSGANEGPPGCQVDPTARLKQGVSSEQIVTFLASRAGYEMAEQALDELCRRSPDVFVRTGPRSWGLIGAGAITNEGQEDQPNIGVGIADCMTDVMLKSPDGLRLTDLIREVRKIIPSAAEQTIRIYLTTLHPERFEHASDNRYRLKQKYLEFLEKPDNREPTINILTRVVREAEAPLSTDEIIARCEQIQFVSHSAIRGYLTQNYDGRFKRLDNGKYTAS